MCNVSTPVGSVSNQLIMNYGLLRSGTEKSGANLFNQVLSDEFWYSSLYFYTFQIKVYCKCLSLSTVLCKSFVFTYHVHHDQCNYIFGGFKTTLWNNHLWSESRNDPKLATSLCYPQASEVRITWSSWWT
jgi:hypothetical protein